MTEEKERSSHHLVDIRGLVFSPIGKFYIGFYFGKNSRTQKDSIDQDRRKSSTFLSILLGGVFLTGALALSIFALSLTLYALKTSLGINLLPNSPMQTILETLKICHRLKPHP